MKKQSQRFYKLASKPEQVFESESDAVNEASTICHARAEPQLLMTCRPDGVLVDWQVVCTESLFDRRKGALVTLIGNPQDHAR